MSPITISPLTGVLDLRSTPDLIAKDGVRMRQNLQTTAEGTISRGCGWSKLLTQSNYNNSDFHDQLLDLSGLPFTPLDRGTDLAGWYEADGLVFNASATAAADGEAVAQWNDQSGNGRHLVQATGAQRPLFQTNILNGLPGIQFVSSDDLTAAAGVSPVIAAPMTIYMVGKSSDTAALQYPVVIWTTGSSTVGFYLGWWGAGVGDPLIWQAVSSASGTVQTTTGYAADTPYIVTAQEASLSSRSIWKDGGSVGTNGSVSDINLLSHGAPNVRFSVGRPGNSAATSPFIGYIFEVIVINQADDAVQRAAMESYLRNKWGI